MLEAAKMVILYHKKKLRYVRAALKARIIYLQDTFCLLWPDILIHTKEIIRIISLFNGYQSIIIMYLIDFTYF